MKEITIKRLAGVLLGALIVWGVLAGAGRLREDRAPRFSLPHVDSAAIDTIALERRGDTATLARHAHVWRVNGFPVDNEHVHDLLRGLVDSAEWGELVAENPSSYARLGVGADSGLRLRVVSHGKQVVDVTSGKRTTDWTGIYLRRNGDSAVYALHSALLGEALTRPADDWRDKRIARINPDSVATVDVQRGARRTMLQRAGVKWTVEAEPADSAAVAGMLDLYKTFDATGFASAAQADSLRPANRVAAVRLRSKSGALLLGIRFDSTAGGGWARADSGGPVFKIDPYQLAHLAPAESTFKTRKKVKK